MLPLLNPAIRRAAMRAGKECARPKLLIEIKTPTRPRIRMGLRPYRSLTRPHSSTTHACAAEKALSTIPA